MESDKVFFCVVHFDFFPRSLRGKFTVPKMTTALFPEVWDHFKRNLVFQSSFFRGYVKFPGEFTNSLKTNSSEEYAKT